ncbi:MAG: MFS transporter [Desulfotignum sp.]|nr:MFS transporter [Desulfotignum sp.]MCF8125889.1 MFS transporter [Desulfotignum sp.]
MTPAPNQTNSKFPYLTVVFLTAIFFLNFIIRIIISPLMPTILEDMGLTPDQAGSFFLVSASGYCVALLCSGFVSSRFLHVKTIVFSAIATGLMMVLTGLSHNLTLMRWAVFAAGMAAGLYLPSGIAILTTTVTEKNWGKAMGIHELAPNMSFLLAPVLCEALLLWMTWRQVLFCVGAASILMGLSFLRFFRIRDFAGKSPKFNALAPLAATPSFWCMMLLFSLGVSGTLGIYAMLPLFLVNAHGMAQAQANTLITLSRVATLPMPLVIGWISDRFGLKPVLATVLAVNGLLVFGIGVSNGFLLQVWVFCQPVVAVCFFPPAFAALSRIGSEKMRSVAVSFTIPAAFLAGGGLVPSLIGFLGDRGWFAAGFMAAGGLVLAGAAVPFFLTFHRPEN